MVIGGIEMNNFKQFYKRSLEDRKKVLNQTLQIDPNAYQNLDLDVADNMIENAIGVYEIPLGIAPNFLINNKPFVVPMATEEPSVIAAASNGAKTIAQSGGFVARVENRAMIGEIAFHNPKNHEIMDLYLKYNFPTLLNIAKKAHPSIHNRGGGLVSVTSKMIQERGRTPFYVVYFTIDTQEAMGANIVNTILEAIKPHLEETFKLKSIMSIISNYAMESLVTATCELDPLNVGLSEEDCKLFQVATDLAFVDPYRTATHNKGTMNGITAVTLATGNDTRSIEAGAHSYASRNGVYEPLATWSYDDGKLKGSITIPMALGTVGTSIRIHPKAQLAHKILRLQDAKELMMVTASVGLAQNFAALKALTSEGIQKGHMGLQARSLLLSVGVQENEMQMALNLLEKEPTMNIETATRIMNTIRQR